MVAKNEIELYNHGKILTLNKSRYMLIELPANIIPIYTEDLFFQLMLQGLTPILAHPERNSVIIKNPDIVLKYVKKGVLIQVNAGSIMGMFGNKVKKTVENFFKNNIVHFIASDAHNTLTRAPRLKDAFEWLNATTGTILECRILEL